MNTSRVKGAVGRVIEKMPNAMYKVKFEDGKELLCYLAGKMKIHKISLYVGDMVDVIIDPYEGKTSNRIIYKL